MRLLLYYFFISKTDKPTTIRKLQNKAQRFVVACMTTSIKQTMGKPSFKF